MNVDNTLEGTVKEREMYHDFLLEVSTVKYRLNIRESLE
jgi:hypothetical protein